MAVEPMVEYVVACASTRRSNTAHRTIVYSKWLDKHELARIKRGM
jgi:hypothetical protein